MVWLILQIGRQYRIWGDKCFQICQKLRNLQKLIHEKINLLKVCSQWKFKKIFVFINLTFALKNWWVYRQGLRTISNIKVREESKTGRINMCNFDFSSPLLNIFRGGPPKNKFNWHANEYLNPALISENF